MNVRLARLLTRLYPRAWRQRYGKEFQAFLETERAGLRGSWNVVWSAMCEHMMPTQRGDMAQSALAGQFHSWCVRAPWAVFGLAPLLLLAGAYFIACLYLWTVWTIFLPGADTPFGARSSGALYGFQNLSFQFGKFYYFGAPIVVGWAIGFAAARQRMKAIWPSAGLLLVALMGGTAEIHASRKAVPAGLGHIRMDFFAFGPSAQSLYTATVHALVIFVVTVLPWLILRRFERSRSSQPC